MASGNANSGIGSTCARREEVARTWAAILERRHPGTRVVVSATTPREGDRVKEGSTGGVA